MAEATLASHRTSRTTPWRTRAGGPSAVVVPAYFHPAVAAEDWDTLARPGQPVGAIVLNIASGPGTALEPDLHTVATRTAAAGIPVLGYLDTTYGRRPAEDLFADMTSYLRWYAIRGFFFDQVATGVGALPWYREAAVTARSLGAEQVVFNHGAYPDPAYAGLADDLVTFEGPLRAYEDVVAPPWVREHDPARFWHLVYDTPKEHLGATLRHAARCHAGTVLVTDRAGANPWDGLPSYFGHELAAVGIHGGKPG
ncbi:MAG: Spherulin-4 [Actinomycetia bacterium]|nr:Spherulin-4 [Actinomycetes bacterium]MDQ1658016.1 hypothetical protein [Cryptosporangiaceae bacterium]